MYKGQTCDLGGYSICRLCAMLYGSGIPEAPIFYFFYSQEVWSELLLRNRCGSSHFLLSELIPWVNLHASGFSLASTILKISVSATVYRIWEERNRRTFQHSAIRFQGEFGRILEDVKACFSSWRKFPSTDDNNWI